MIDQAAKYILALSTLALSALILSSEFVPLPADLSFVGNFSNFSKYFICLITATSCAWLHLDKYFANSNTHGGAFHSLSRVISFAMGLSAILDFISKTNSTNLNLLFGIKLFGFLFFISLICSIRNLINVKVKREIQLKCGDPISQTLLLNGLLEFIVALSLLTYPASVPSIMAKVSKLSKMDQLVLRVFASLNLGFSLMNFASVGLPEQDATNFLHVRKLQYLNILVIFMILQYLKYFSPLHTMIVIGVLLQFVFILFPKMKEEQKEKDE
jgi:hypothetical protein